MRFVKKMLKPLARLAQWFALASKPNAAGDWVDGEPRRAATSTKSLTAAYEPDAEFEEISTRMVESPVAEFNRALMKGDVAVAEAYVWEGRMSASGGLVPQPVLESVGALLPWRTRRVSGQDYRRSLAEAAKEFKGLPVKAAKAREAKATYLGRLAKLKEAGLLRENFDADTDLLRYDAGQYTEFTPTYGGPFNKQLYLHDYLKMHAIAFEAKNHNPVAKRIIDVLSQYAFGKRFKVRIKDDRKREAWKKFDRENKIVHRVCKFWGREYLTYGEFMLDKDSLNSIDPSTVWDIITDPENISKVYYYYQSYSTAFQQFTGIKVPGAPAGSAKAKPVQYIVKQIPAKQVIHIKSNVMSQEKRGRSVLFPILGWLKRLKDLLNSTVTRAQLQASFLWDDTIEGDQSAVDAHLARYASMPVGLNLFAHNSAVKRQGMPVLDSSGNRGKSGVGDEVLCMIATGAGIPKQFLNILNSTADPTATSLVSAEPFEKVIEELQADMENLLLELVEDLFVELGLGYEEGDVEFMFPSVTKDTTTEALANISQAESLGYIDHRTASEMSAAELGISTYDYDDIQDAIKKYTKDKPLDPFPGLGGAGGGPMGKGPKVPGKDGTVPRRGSGAGGLHGTAKAAKKDQLK